MDIYRALNLDIPLLMLSITHQSATGVSEESYLHALATLHQELKQDFQVAREALQTWQMRNAALQADETLQKLQRLGFLNGGIEPEEIHRHLLRDYQRLGLRIGSESLLGDIEIRLTAYQEIAEEQIAPELRPLLKKGREALLAANFHLDQGITGESQLLFRSSLNYDVLDRLLRERLRHSPETYVAQFKVMKRLLVGTFQLVYQVGLDLSAADEASELIFSFDENLISYWEIRQQLAALLEELAEKLPLLHGSYWQHRGVPGIDNQGVLRFLLPAPGRTAGNAASITDLTTAIVEIAESQVRAMLVGGQLVVGQSVVLRG